MNCEYIVEIQGVGSPLGVSCPREGSLMNELVYWLGRRDVGREGSNTRVIAFKRGTGESYLKETARKLRDCRIKGRHG